MRETKMAPFALQRVEFEIPAEAPVPDLSSRAAAFDCPDPAHPNTYSAAKRLVLNAGVVPRYEGEIRDAVAPAESTPARIRTNR